MIGRTELARKMQEYMDDAPILPGASKNYMEGFNNLSCGDAVKLFNDFLMFLGEGRDPPVPVLDPTEGKG